MCWMSKVTLFVIFALIGYIVTEEKNRFNFRDGHHIDAIVQRCPGFCNKKFCKIESSCRPVNRTSKLKRLDIYFHEGVKLEAPVLIEISTFKKFGTQYRPLMFTGKDDLCKHLLTRDHPLFAFFGVTSINGNLYDVCPLSGHRYEAPIYTKSSAVTLVPTGEWRVDYILSKVINGTEEHILTIYLYYLVKAKDATQF